MYIRIPEGLGQPPLRRVAAPPAPLTQKQLKHVQDALADAFKVIKHKILKPLEEILSGRVPPRGSRLDCALMANFNLSQGDSNYRTLVGEILRRFGVIHVLYEQRADIRISPTLDPDCGNYNAYVREVTDQITGKTISTIHACNGFFTLKTPLEQTATIIHELMHAYVGAGMVRLPAVIDVDYYAGPSTAGCKPNQKWTLPTSQLISNGQSYEEFVLNLIKGSKHDETFEVKGK